MTAAGTEPTTGLGALTPIAAEIEQIHHLVCELERQLAIEQENGCDRARWGIWSHEWNERRMRLMKRVAEGCRDSSLAHRRAHLALAYLFSAWQRIHSRISEGRPPDLSGLEEVKRRLAEAASAMRAA